MVRRVYRDLRPNAPYLKNSNSGDRGSGNADRCYSPVVVDAAGVVRLAEWPIVVRVVHQIPIASR